MSSQQHGMLSSLEQRPIPACIQFAVGPLEQIDASRKLDHVTVLVNFFDELRRIAPGTR